MSKKEISVLIGLVFTIMFSVTSQYIVQAEEIKNNTLRLHIIANSDSDYDQQCKIKVRDALLDMENLLPIQAENFNQAVEITKSNIRQIEDNLNTFLKEYGAEYKATCTIENFYFDTTKYPKFALPQGEYKALTVRLGNAEGKNWWCVMYPALCSQSVGEMVFEKEDEFIKTETITARFKIIEIYENIKQKISGKYSKKYDKV